MDCTIRKTRAADAQAVARLQAAWVKRFAPAHYSQRVVDAWVKHASPGEVTAALDRQDLDNLVAVGDGTIVGFAQLRGNEILSLYIMPPENLPEVGAQFIDRMKKMLELKGRRRLRVNAPLSLKSFYESIGFESVGKSIHTISEKISIACWEMQLWVTKNR